MAEIMETNQVAPDGLVAAAQNLDFAVALIEQIRGGASARAPVAGVMEMIDALLRGVPYLSYPMPHDTRLFRGRIENKVGRFSDLKEFSYCPVERSTSIGRCHLPGSTVFYGSMNLDTVLAELAPEVGDTVHVGVASPRAGERLSATVISEIDHFRRYGKPLLGDESASQALQEIIDGSSSGNPVRTLLVDAFFGDLFLQPASSPRDRKATAALSTLLLEAKGSDGRPLNDAFAYPSVAHRGGLNFAIRPDSFDRCMTWENLMVFEITGYRGFGLYGRRELAKCDPTEMGQLNWEEHRN